MQLQDAQGSEHPRCVLHWAKSSFSAVSGCSYILHWGEIMSTHFHRALTSFCVVLLGVTFKALVHLDFSQIQTNSKAHFSLAVQFTMLHSQSLNAGTYLFCCLRLNMAIVLQKEMMMQRVPAVARKYSPPSSLTWYKNNVKCYMEITIYKFHWLHLKTIPGVLTQDSDCKGEKCPFRR